MHAALKSLDRILAEIGLRREGSVDSPWQRSSETETYYQDVRPIAQSWSRSARRQAARNAASQAIPLRTPPLFIGRLLVRNKADKALSRSARENSPETHAQKGDKPSVQIILDWYNGSSRTNVQTFWEYLKRKFKDAQLPAVHA